MMFLIARKRRCTGRRNPLLAAVLGGSSALMFGAATLIERHDGEHWPIAVAAVICVALIGLAVLRLVALTRDGGGL